MALLKKNRDSRIMNSLIQKGLLLKSIVTLLQITSSKKPNSRKYNQTEKRYPPSLDFKKEDANQDCSSLNPS